MPIPEPWFDWCIKGSWNRVEPTVRRKLGRFKRFAAEHYSGCVKVGATNNPYVRWTSHKRGTGWEEMVVLWETTSYRDVSRAERTLIEWASRYEDADCMNFVGGGGGLSPSATHHYVYVLLG